MVLILFFFFFFNQSATTEIYTLSLHDALPILAARCSREPGTGAPNSGSTPGEPAGLPRRIHGIGWMRRAQDRKSTRLNSSHVKISYAVFCLKKKKENKHVSRCEIDNPPPMKSV